MDHRKNLSHDDLQLLLALQEDPVASFTQISRKIGKSVKTVSRWMQNLEASGLIYPTQAILNNPLLGLELIDVLVSLPSLKAVEIVENLGTSHPYTVYRSRINGAMNGLYFQFRAPIGTKNEFHALFRRLQTTGLVTDWSLFVSPIPSITTKFDLKFYEASTLSWSFAWDNWKEALESHEPQELGEITLGVDRMSKLDSIDILDVFLLGLLNANAKMKLSDAAKNLEREGFGSLAPTKVTPQRISDRLKYLRETFVSDYRLYLNTKVLDLYNTVLVRAKCGLEFREKLRDTLSRRPIPFPSHLRLIDDGFLWYLSMPASHFAKVTQIIWREEVEKYEVNVVDYMNSMTYGLWHKAFSDNKWIISKEFLIESPLEEVLKKSA